MSGPVPFRLDELDGVTGAGTEDPAGLVSLARELEASAARTGARPSPEFADRVMAMVAAEPLPAPTRAAGSAVRHARLGALLVSIRDAFRVTFSGRFPAVIRAQAFALVLLVVGLSAGTALGAASAVGLLERGPSPSPVQPAPTQTVAPTPAPTVEPQATPGETVEPSASPEPEATESPTDDTPGATEGPGETPDDNGGDGAGDGSSSNLFAAPEPTDDPSSGGDHEGGGDPTATPAASPTASPRPSPSPEPDGTPRPTQSPDPSQAPGSSSTEP